MNKFFHVSDIGDLKAALAEARQVKQTPYAWKHLGENRTRMNEMKLKRRDYVAFALQALFLAAIIIESRIF